MWSSLKGKNLLKKNKFISFRIDPSTRPAWVQDSLPDSALPITQKNFNVKLQNFANGTTTAAITEAGGIAYLFLYIHIGKLKWEEKNEIGRVASPEVVPIHLH